MEYTFAGLPLPLRIKPPYPLTDDELLRVCEQSEILVIEREPDGSLAVCQLPGLLHSAINVRITTALMQWHRLSGVGQVVGSGCGFILPDGSMRTPSAAWFSKELCTVAKLDHETFPQLCPEFIIELRRVDDTEAAAMKRMNCDGKRVGSGMAD